MKPSKAGRRGPLFLWLLALLAVELALVAIVQPRGEFPVNDDWAYAHSVRWLLEEGRLRLSDWIGMNLAPQALAGGAIAWAAGFSFEGLRHLTQAVSFAAMTAAFACFRACAMGPRDALVATVAMVAFPAWPVLANSFMTDIYGLALGLACAWFFLRYLSQPRARLLVLGTAIAAVGVLERQVIFVVPFGFMAAWLWTRPWRARALAIAAGPIAFCLLAEFAYRAYLAAGPGVPAMQDYMHGRVLPLALKALTDPHGHGRFVVSNAVGIAGYLGLFMAGWGLWHGMPGAPRALRIGIAASGGALAAVMLSTGTLPPFRPMQVVDAAGIGPFITYDTVRGLTVLDRSPGLVWRIAGVAAAFGSVALLATGFEAARRAVRLRRGASPHAVFLLAVIGAYLVPFILVDYFDRYLLFVLPFAMALWAITWKGAAPPAPVRRAAAVAWIVATLLVAALATRDYFAWNRARWDAIREAQRRGATPATLDGGFEYNGYTGYETRRSPGPQGGSLEAKSWYWVVDDDYVVAFGPVPGYRELRTFPVKRWLSRTPGEVVLLRRIR